MWCGNCQSLNSQHLQRKENRLKVIIVAVMSTVNRSHRTETLIAQKGRSAYLRLSIRRHYEINSPRGQFPLHQVEPKRWLSSTKEILKKKVHIWQGAWKHQQQATDLSVEWIRPTPPSPSPPFCQYHGWTLQLWRSKWAMNYRDKF